MIFSNHILLRQDAAIGGDPKFREMSHFLTSHSHQDRMLDTHLGDLSPRKDPPFFWGGKTLWEVENSKDINFLKTDFIIFMSYLASFGLFWHWTKPLNTWIFFHQDGIESMNRRVRTLAHAKSPVRKSFPSSPRPDRTDLRLGWAVRESTKTFLDLSAFNIDILIFKILISNLWQLIKSVYTILVSSPWGVGILQIYCVARFAMAGSSISGVSGSDPSSSDSPKQVLGLDAVTWSFNQLAGETLEVWKSPPGSTLRPWFHDKRHWVKYLMVNSQCYNCFSLQELNRRLKWREELDRTGGCLVSEHLDGTATVFRSLPFCFGQHRSSQPAEAEKAAAMILLHCSPSMQKDGFQHKNTCWTNSSKFNMLLEDLEGTCGGWWRMWSWEGIPTWSTTATGGPVSWT